MDWDPDAKSEDSSSYDGAFSYSTENHSAIIGAVSGLMGRVTLGTEYEVVGVGIMVAVVCAALGIEGFKRMSNSKAAAEVSKEPWYALGSVLPVYYIPDIAACVMGVF